MGFRVSRSGALHHGPRPPHSGEGSGWGGGTGVGFRAKSLMASCPLHTPLQHLPPVHSHTPCPHPMLWTAGNVQGCEDFGPSIIPRLHPTPSSEHTWPNPMRTLQDCEFFGPNITTCNGKTESYQGLWEVPLYQIEDPAVSSVCTHVCVCGGGGADLGFGVRRAGRWVPLGQIEDPAVGSGWGTGTR